VACADEKNGLWRIGPDKSVSVVIKDHKGKLLNGPNDVWIRPQGGLYFTDPFYSDPTGNAAPKNRIVRRSIFWQRWEGVDSGRIRLAKTNGIIGTPDGKTLYVADIDAKKTFDTIFKPTVH